MGNEMKRILPIACVIFALLAVNAIAASKPEITKCDIHYSNNAINANIHWQSENPVTKVKIFTGPELKEIAVDEYDNRRNPQGYSGEVSAVIPITNPGEFVAYVVQVEDDLHQKSEQTVGKVAAITKLDPMAAAQINVQQSIQIGQQQQATQIMPVIGAPQVGTAPMGTAPMGTTPVQDPAAAGTQMGVQQGLQIGIQTGAQPGQTTTGSPVADMVGQVVAAAAAVNLAPVIVEMVLNRPTANTINVKLKINDDKGLKEVKVKVIDANGGTVQEQTVTMTGKTWEGVSPDFALSAGTFKVVAQATDEGGAVSKDKSETFTIN